MWNIFLKQMRSKTQHKDLIRSKISVETSASITDYRYNHNGSQLAVADSDGNIFIYQRNGEVFNKTAQIKGDDAAIWKISWADASYGDVIAIGSFKRKVAVFQNKNNNWTEIAYHELHEGSVNHVQWAPIEFGLKLYSVGSEGSVAILQLKKNVWNQFSFCAHQCSINSLSIRPLALNQSSQDRINSYPMIVTVAKDNAVKVWRHIQQINQEQLLPESKIYQQIAIFKPHKESIRTLLWKKRWFESVPIKYEIFTSSQDGTVKLTAFQSDKVTQTITICEYENPIFKISQSLTGNMISVSVANEEEKSYLYAEQQNWQNWNLIEQLK